jgi:DNA-binding transcriptional LysR family regulator
MSRARSPATLNTSLLVLFDEIYRTRSVTRTAERLNLSQPTVSVWLAKLRRQMRDPLFVRTSGGMESTPRADAMVGPVREALALLRRLSTGDAGFDPAVEKHDFRVCMTDASHVTLLPRLLAHVRQVAPGVRFEVLPITHQTGDELASGDADLALGYIPGLEAGFHEQSLYMQDFVCLVSTHHPRIRHRLTLQAFRSESHVGILSSASYTMLQASLKRQKVERQIVLELPGFLGLAFIVSSTDLIATVPRTIGEALAAAGAIRVLACPAKVPSFAVKQYWHSRLQHDAAHRWLRATCNRLFAQG